MDQKTGTFAILAILAAIGSYFATFWHHSILGFIVGIAAIPLGVGGLVMAASPRVSGGFISIIAIILGVIASILAILVGLGRLVF